MKTTTQGRQAETIVANELKKRGFEILAQNWRTRVCEIDIVAKKKPVIYFVEVKYRGSQAQGDGLNYITNRKLKQLHFAAQIWNQQNSWNGDYRLLAAAVSLNEEIDFVELE